jgi:hypothetical protein
MSIARLIALALITASSCTSNVGDGHTRETPASSGGNEEASPLSAPVVSGNVIRCRSVRVPRVELDTNLDREHGLLTVNYTTRTSAMNRSFTIAYNDDHLPKGYGVSKAVQERRRLRRSPRSAFRTDASLLLH